MLTQDQVFNRLAGIAVMHRNNAHRNFSAGSSVRWTADKFEQDYGYKVLGGGHFSIVIEHPEHQDRVLKIGFGGGFTRPYSEDGWLGLAMYSLKHSAKFLPLIYGIKCYNECYIVDMEKLEQLDPDVPWQNYAYINFRNFVYDRGRVPLKPNECLGEDCQGGLLHMFSELGVPDDIHAGNVMLRLHADGTAQLVVTDAYAFRQGMSKKYHFEQYKTHNGTIDIEFENIENIEHKLDRHFSVRYGPWINNSRALLHADFNNIEARALAHMHIHKDEFDGILAKGRQEPIVRTAHKNTVLLDGQLNAGRAWVKGIQRVVLPLSQQSVRGAWGVKSRGIGGKKANFVIPDSIFAAPTPERRHNRRYPVARRSERLAVTGRNTVDASTALQAGLQPVSKKGMRTRVRELCWQQFFFGGPDHAKHRRDKAQVHSEEPR